MQTSGNTILITGGGSGIGRGLAAAFHHLGNRVIIAGRRQQALDATTADYPGMRSLQLDLEDAAAIRAFAGKAQTEFPALNVLINNSGIMRVENLQDESDDLADAEAMINTNLLGTMRLTAALLPLFRSQAHATIMTVTSGLAFVPMAPTPTYCATKAAVHSWTQSLRYQLRETSIQVLELIPPYVQTELMGEHQASDPNAMPLDAFIAETMELLTTHPDSTEICVSKVLPLRYAEKGGHYDDVFRGLNEMAAAMATH